MSKREAIFYDMSTCDILFNPPSLSFINLSPHPPSSKRFIYSCIYPSISLFLIPFLCLSKCLTMRFFFLFFCTMSFPVIYSSFSSTYLLIFFIHLSIHSFLKILSHSLILLMHTFTDPFIHLSIYLPIHHLFIYLSIYSSIFLSTTLFIPLFTHIFIQLSVSSSIYPSIPLSTYSYLAPFTHLSILSYIHLLISPCAHTHFFLYYSFIPLPTYLSLPPFTNSACDHWPC